jgi:hypothetical protein
MIVCASWSIGGATSSSGGAEDATIWPAAASGLNNATIDAAWTDSAGRLHLMTDSGLALVVSASRRPARPASHGV